MIWCGGSLGGLGTECSYYFENSTESPSTYYESQWLDTGWYYFNEDDPRSIEYPINGTVVELLDMEKLLRVGFLPGTLGDELEETYTALAEEGECELDQNICFANGLSDWLTGTCVRVNQ